MSSLCCCSAKISAENTLPEYYHVPLKKAKLPIFPLAVLHLKELTTTHPNDIVILIDKQKDIIFGFNSRLESKFGYTPQILLGKSIDFLLNFKKLRLTTLLYSQNRSTSSRGFTTEIKNIKESRFIPCYFTKEGFSNKEQSEPSPYYYFMMGVLHNPQEEI